MTVAELIAILQKLPQDAIVVASADDTPYAHPVEGASWSGADNDGRMLDDGDDAIHFVDLHVGFDGSYEILCGDEG